MRRLLLVLVLAAGAATIAGVAAARHATTPNPFATRASRAAEIHFVPLDQRAAGLLRATVPGVKRWVPHPTEITDVPTAKATWTNSERGQINAAVVLDDVLSRYRRALGAQRGIVMAVSSASLYDPNSPQYRFVFGLRGRGGTQVAAVVGTAQMRVFHPEREKARLTKMMLRYFGEFLCRLPRNSNPTSVMYSPILSDADLDRMVAKLPKRC
jgi:hypothetical protein